MRPMLDAVDLYCGAGGMTTGAHRSGHVRVVLAVNHWRPAIRTHQDNHPATRHICAEVQDVDPHADESLPDCHIVMAGVECTQHSNARGGTPVCDQKRSTARNVLDWVRAKKPEYMIVENVREFQDWGRTRLKLDKNGKRIWDKKHRQWAREAHPDHKGEHFRRWVADLEREGYRVEWRLLNAADYGEAQKRIRLFVIARRGGRPITWPETTHTKVANGKPKWRGAWEIIDWSLSAESVFGRKRPLAKKTLMRIKIGLLKFNAPKSISEAVARAEAARSAETSPFLVKYRGTNHASAIDAPLPTITAGGNHLYVAEPYLVTMKGRSNVNGIGHPVPTLTTRSYLGVSQPFIVKYHSGDPRKWLKCGTVSAVDPLPTVDTNPRFAIAEPFLVQTQGPGVGDMRYAGVHSAAEPLRTLLGRVNHGIATPFVYAQPFLVPNFGERSRQVPRSHSIADPLPAVTGHGAGCLASPFILPRQGYFDSRRLKRCQSIDEPLNTITANHVPAHLVVPYLIEVNHGEARPGGRVHSLDSPIGTITGKRSHGLIVPEPFLVKYHGTGRTNSIRDPLSTVTTKERHGLTLFGDGQQSAKERRVIALNADETDVFNTLLLLGLDECYFRMLVVPELARAMGLGDDYVIHGTKQEQIKQVGNMVCVRVMTAICEAIGQSIEAIGGAA